MGTADASQCVTSTCRPCARKRPMHSRMSVHLRTSSHFSVPLLMRADCLYVAFGVSTMCSCPHPNAVAIR